MPGFITHCIFGEKVFEKTEHEMLCQILADYKKVYMLGSQGPDIFFYNPLTHFYKDERNIGVYMHDNSPAAFFANAMDTVCEFPSSEEQKICISYLCGFLGHHFLDRSTHPLINWQTYKIKGNAHENSFRIHSGIETNIDGMYLKKYKQTRPCRISHRKMISASEDEINVVSDFLSRVLNKTYWSGNKRFRKFSPSFVKASIHAMLWGQTLLMDKTALKKQIISTLEEKLLPHPILGGMFITDKPEQYGDYMNLNHKKWHNPWDESKISTASFPELFHEAMLKCSYIFSQLPVNDLKEKSENPALRSLFLEKIGNRSYCTGLTLAEI